MNITTTIEDLFTLEDVPSAKVINDLTRNIVGSVEVHEMVSELKKLKRDYHFVRTSMINKMGEGDYQMFWGSRGLMMEQIADYQIDALTICLTDLSFKEVPKEDHLRIVMLNELYEYIRTDSTTV